MGSRAREKVISYCSKICCMYTAKHTMLYKHKVHDGQAYVFFMDARTPGKGYDEFWRRAVEEEEAVYIRGMVSRMYEKDGKVVVMGSDVLVGVQVEIEADLVVLATAVQARAGADTLAQKLGISYDKYNFYSEAHAKLRPVECATALTEYRRGEIPSAIADWKTILSYDPGHEEASRSLQTALKQLETLKKMPPGK